MLNKNLFVASLTAFFSLLTSVASTAELPPEKIPNVATLPANYPASWVYAHDTNFDSLVAGRVVILDIAADTREYKGALDAAQFATFIESSTRGELYVAETHFSRGTRGERTDVISIYDKVTLSIVDEIVLPGAKRAQIVTNEYAMQLIDSDKYLLVFNFTPAASVTVIDIASRQILAEVAIPGCSMIYPSGDRGFSSLCGDGGMTSVSLAEDGSVKQKKHLDSLFDVDENPLFDKPAYIDDIAYFPSYLGSMQPVKMTGTPEPMDAWSLVEGRERNENWRPSGWQIISANSRHLYVLMQKNGVLGSHKSGGEEVWVFDPGKQQRIRRIVLKQPGFSIEVTGDDDAFLVVTGVDMQISVYDLAGALQRTIGGAAATPLVLHSRR